MLHLRRGIAFGVDVRDLLQLERALERHREVDAPAQIQRIAGVCKPLGQRLDLGFQLQCPGHELWELQQALDQAAAFFGPEAALPPQVERQQHQRHELRSERFGGRDADLRPGVQVDPPVRLTRDGAAHHVDDPDYLRTRRPRRPERFQRVRRLARL